MVEFRNVSVSAGRTKILDGIDLKLTPNTVTVLIGKNASDKSTLLSCLTRERKFNGSITVSGKDLKLMSHRERAQLIALLAQKLPCPDISGEHLVRLGRTPWLDLGRHFTDEDRKSCEAAIETAGARELVRKNVSLMSGGERQKIYLAMLLAQNTPFIALDEPTSYMDARHEREFSTLIADIVKKHRKTALVVMHDLTRAVEIADNIAILDGGKIIFYGTATEAAESGLIESTFGVKAYSCDGIKIYR